MDEEPSRVRRRRTFSASVSVTFPSHLPSSPRSILAICRHLIIARRDTSFPRRTYRRPCSPSRARIRYGAARTTRGRSLTPQVAPPVVTRRARYSPRTVPRLALAPDVDRSIRIPSAYCGIYGLKPGLGRVSFAGSVGALFFPSPLSDAVVCCGVYNVRCVESCGAA